MKHMLWILKSQFTWCPRYPFCNREMCD